MTNPRIANLFADGPRRREAALQAITEAISHDHHCSNACAATEAHMAAMDADAWQQIHEAEGYEPHPHTGPDTECDTCHLHRHDPGAQHNGPWD